jgi:hypothetical protein
LGLKVLELAPIWGPAMTFRSVPRLSAPEIAPLPADTLGRLVRLARRGLAADAVFVCALHGRAARLVAADDAGTALAAAGSEPLDEEAVRIASGATAVVELPAPWRPARVGASVLAVALRSRGEVVAVLGAVSCSPWSDHDERCLLDAAAAMEAALDVCAAARPLAPGENLRVA